MLHTHKKMHLHITKIFTASIYNSNTISKRLSFWSTNNTNSENAYIQSQNDGATTNTGHIIFATKNR